MKSLCFVLFLALTMPGCMFSKTARDQRAYSNYLKHAQAAREKQRKQVIHHQRAEMPSLRNSPSPLETRTEQQAPAPENQ